MGEINEWNVTPKEAIGVQNKLRKLIKIKPFSGKISTIAGADVSFDRFSNVIHAAIVVLSYPSLAEMEVQTATIETSFPYIPGLLSFREIPALLQAWEKLSIRPDVVLVDGQGILHPRRMGIAAHFGLALDVPALGVAKSPLTGSYNDPAHAEGSRENVYDEDGKEVIGTVLRTKANVSPVFVSPGHKMDFDTAVDIVFHTKRKHRLPEPTRRAHEFANSARRAVGEAKHTTQNTEHRIQNTKHKT